jgi:hypothetical protein
MAPSKQKGRTNLKTNPNAEYDITPILRQAKPAAWRLSDDAMNFNVRDTAIITPDDNNDTQIKANLAKWHECGHIKGIQVLHKWDTLPKGQTAQTAYGFSEKSLLNFTDTIGG